MTIQAYCKHQLVNIIITRDATWLSGTGRGLCDAPAFFPLLVVTSHSPTHSLPLQSQRSREKLLLGGRYSDYQGGTECSQSLDNGRAAVRAASSSLRWRSCLQRFLQSNIYAGHLHDIPELLLKIQTFRFLQQIYSLIWYPCRCSLGAHSFDEVLVIFIKHRA